MTQTRYKEKLHTPGVQHSPGPAEIVRNDPAVLADWNKLQTRRSELNERLIDANREQRELESQLGRFVAEGQPWKKHTNRLAELEAEQTALQAAIDYLDGRAELLKRNNYWLA